MSGGNLDNKLGLRKPPPLSRKFYPHHHRHLHPHQDQIPIPIAAAAQPLRKSSQSRLQLGSTQGAKKYLKYLKIFESL